MGERDEAAVRAKGRTNDRRGQPAILRARPSDVSGDPLSARTGHTAPSQCENCGTVLQGHYCHVCGQRLHNPLRHFTHAVEEVLESFWHLDGRVFRTLADLFVPGRVAANYIAGHRVRYLPPLRLFIILSVITFFVGRLTLHFDPSEAIKVDAGPQKKQGIVVGASDDGSAAIRDATSIEEVLIKRTEALKTLENARNDQEVGWVLTHVADFAEKEIDDRARTRMRELGATPEQMRALEPSPADAGNAARPQSGAQVTAPTAGAAANNAATAPASKQPKVEPGFLQRWFEQRMIRLKENAELVKEKPDEFVRLVLSAVPGALFLLVPLFALCLKLLYVRSGRGYLEHLVIALYSHAMLLMALLLTFLLVGLQSWSATPTWLATAASVVSALGLSIAMPLYLLWMQKRVYAQSWPKTLLKFTVLGSVYSVLLSFALVYAVLAGMSG
jgi:hypothetical protein